MVGQGNAPGLVPPDLRAVQRERRGPVTCECRRPDRVSVGGRTDEALPSWREFVRRREGVSHALSGGVWLHRHVWKGHAMAHLVSSNRLKLERIGLSLGLHPARLQYHPLRDPGSAQRTPAWHWDLVGPWLPPLER